MNLQGKCQEVRCIFTEWPSQPSMSREDGQSETGAESEVGLKSKKGGEAVIVVVM